MQIFFAVEPGCDIVFGGVGDFDTEERVVASGVVERRGEFVAKNNHGSIIQLPAYDGTKSYQNLLVEVYGMQIGGAWATPLLNADSSVQLNPVNLTSNGSYSSSSGSISGYNSEGYYSQSRVYSDINIIVSRFTHVFLLPQNALAKGNGFTVRCLVRLGPRQLPTYDGTKSYQNLLVGVYGGQYVDGSMGINRADAFLQQLPTNLIRSGYYSYKSGSIGNSNGNYWELQAHSITNTKYLVFNDNLLSPRFNDNKGVGYSLRCLVARTD